MRVVSSFLLLILVGTTATSAPAPPQPKANYYPLKVGTKWTFKGEASGKAFEISNRVVEEETINGVKMARIETEIGGRTVTSEHVGVTDKGIFRYRYNGVKTDPPLCLLKFPVKESDRWQNEITSGTDTAKLTTEVGSAEVTVAAGTFKTVRVRMEGKVGTRDMSTTYWFADGYGIVRQEAEFNGIKMSLELEKLESAK